MVSGGITKDDLSKINVYLHWICGLKIKVNSVLHVRLDEWIYSRCDGVKRVTTKFGKYLLVH